MHEPQKIISSKLRLNSSLWQILSNTQQEIIKGGVFDAFTKIVVAPEPNPSRIDKSTPLIAKALCSN
ncbi:MAG: hypothetical protein KME23_28910 [Goleter apudmare HA4340-LM2]|jgi:hypothetical protein|nr:hypothetical protein [Goleter apudmare HA4340-LM2]